MSCSFALIPFLNMLPFTAAPPPPGWRKHPLPPRAAWSALLSGAIAAAPVPVAGLLPLLPVAEPLSEFGIASWGAVGSVLLLSQRPWAAWLPSDLLLLPDDSLSSIALLLLLLADDGLVGARLPRLAWRADGAQGRLVIGDTALAQARTGAWRQVFDLARLWRERRGLPFVFARWMVRRDLPAAARAELSAWIDACDRQREGLIAAALPAHPLPEGLSQREAADYLAGLHYRLTPEDRLGEARFLRELAALPAFPPRVRS